MADIINGILNNTTTALGIGRQFDDLGNPLLLRNNQTATRNYGFNQLTLSREPKAEFQFYVELTVNPNIISNGGTQYSNLGLNLKSASLPSYRAKTETLNQYNKKRVIQKSVEYDAVKIEYYDTVNNDFMYLSNNYFNYYYGDGYNLNSNAWSADIVTGNYNEPQNAQSWGFSPYSDNLAKFFSSISIYQVYKGLFSGYQLINPVITKCDRSRLNMENSKGCTGEFEVEYEGYVVLSPQPLSDNQKLINLMGLAGSDFYEPLNDVIAYDAASYASNFLSGLPSSNSLISDIISSNLSSLVPNILNNNISNVNQLSNSILSASIGAGINFVSSDIIRSLDSGASTISTSSTSGFGVGTITNNVNPANIVWS